jgi:hypothetical protein
LGLNSERASSLPKDHGLDQMKEVILLVLSDEPFSSVQQMADRPQDVCSKKHCISSICRFSALHSQASDILIGLLTSSPTVRRQVKSSRAADPTSRPPVGHQASRIGWGHILHILRLGERVIVLLVDRSDDEMI